MTRSCAIDDDLIQTSTLPYQLKLLSVADSNLLILKLFIIVFSLFLRHFKRNHESFYEMRYRVS
jgi:hypothetical protein